MIKIITPRTVPLTGTKIVKVRRFGFYKSLDLAEQRHFVILKLREDSFFYTVLDIFKMMPTLNQKLKWGTFIWHGRF